MSPRRHDRAAPAGRARQHRRPDRHDARGPAVDDEGQGGHRPRRQRPGLLVPAVHRGDTRPTGGVGGDPSREARRRVHRPRHPGGARVRARLPEGQRRDLPEPGLRRRSAPASSRHVRPRTLGRPGDRPAALRARPRQAPRTVQRGTGTRLRASLDDRINLRSLARPRWHRCSGRRRRRRRSGRSRSSSARRRSRAPGRPTPPATSTSCCPSPHR